MSSSLDVVTFGGKRGSKETAFFTLVIINIFTIWACDEKRNFRPLLIL